MYGFSVLHCLPVGLEDQPSAATGTVMRADTLRGYARSPASAPSRCCPGAPLLPLLPPARLGHAAGAIGLESVADIRDDMTNASAVTVFV